MVYVYMVFNYPDYFEESYKTLDDIILECGIDIYGINEAETNDAFVGKASKNLRNRLKKFRTKVDSFFVNIDSKIYSEQGFYNKYHEKILKKIKNGELNGFKYNGYSYAYLSKFINNMNNIGKDYQAITTLISRDIARSNKFSYTKLLWKNDKYREKCEIECRKSFALSDKIFHTNKI